MQHRFWDGVNKEEMNLFRAGGGKRGCMGGSGVV